MESKIGQKARTASTSEAAKIDLRNEIQEAFRSHPVSWFHWVFEHLILPRDATILDIGTGPGTLWQENDRRIPRTWHVLISDRFTGMLRAARENLDPIPVTGCLCLDGQSLPFPDEAFDTVLALGVLDLIPDPANAIREAARVLRPSGQLIASAGGRRHLKEMEALIRPFVAKEKAEGLGGVENHFGLENGARLLSSAFSSVSRSNYNDRLEFRSIQPILDYILSEDAIMESMTLQQLSRFLQLLKEHIIQEGRITVTVQKGLFIARKTGAL